MLSEIFLYFSIIFYDKYISGANEEEAKVAQINHMSFKYPTSPLLSQPENTAEESVCSLEKRSKECADTPLFCECIRMIEVSPNKNVDIVLIDQGKSSKRFIFIIQVHCFLFSFPFFFFFFFPFIQIFDSWFRFRWKCFLHVPYTWLQRKHLGKRKLWKSDHKRGSDAFGSQRTVAS